MAEVTPNKEPASAEKKPEISAEASAEAERRYQVNKKKNDRRQRKKKKKSNNGDDSEDDYFFLRDDLKGGGGGAGGGGGGGTIQLVLNLISCFKCAQNYAFIQFSSV
jgi:hypothetical protein